MAVTFLIRRGVIMPKPFDFTWKFYAVSDDGFSSDARVRDQLCRMQLERIARGTP
jgi:hypothetical protein